MANRFGVKGPEVSTSSVTLRGDDSLLVEREGTLYQTQLTANTPLTAIVSESNGDINITPNGTGSVVLDGQSFPQADGTADQVLSTDGAAQLAYANMVMVKEVTFTEAGDTTYTGSVTIPAGATILDIQLRNTALWDDTGAVTAKVGDAVDDDGWYTGVNMKATDLLVNEVINFNYTGGKEGAFIVTASGTFTDSYNADASVVTGVITTTNQDGTAGRSRMLVVYAVPFSVTAATGA